MTALTDSPAHIQDVLRVADASGIHPKQVTISNNGMTKTFKTETDDIHHIDDLRKIVEQATLIRTLQAQLGRASDALTTE